MKPRKPTKPSKQDKARQKKIEKNVKTERLEINHPQGKERFDKVIELVKRD